jgi:hypothetical protein
MRLQMSKKSVSQEPKVTDISAVEIDPDKLVAQAARWATALWRRAEADGGGKERAMFTAANWAKVSPNTFWKLKYRPPRDLGVSIYFRLQAAHERHVSSVEAQIAANLEELRALPATAARERLMAQMEEFLGASQSPENEDQSAHWGGADRADN